MLRSTLFRIRARRLRFRCRPFLRQSALTPTKRTAAISSNAGSLSHAVMGFSTNSERESGRSCHGSEMPNRYSLENELSECFIAIVIPQELAHCDCNFLEVCHSFTKDKHWNVGPCLEIQFIWT
jgi:hypothetical protein